MKVNIQNSKSKYTLIGLRRRVSALFNKNDIDTAQRVSAIFVEAWLENQAPLCKAKWDVFVDEHQDWHIRVKLKTRHTKAFRGAVTVMRSDDLKGVHYRDMFLLIALEHNRVINGWSRQPYVPTETLLEPKIMVHTQVRGTHFYDDKQCTARMMDDMALDTALTPDEVEEEAKEARMNNASVLQLLGEGNFRIRG